MNRVSPVPRLIGIGIGLLLGLYYIGVQIIGWSPVDDDYEVSVDVPRSAGLFEDSDVSYRGVRIGKVTSMEVSPSGVHLRLSLSGDQPVPQRVEARVRMLSALGESYVDLVPTTTVPAGSGEPHLEAGSTIATGTVPTTVSEALASSTALLRSLDPADLDTVQTLMADAFSGLAPELRTLVVGGQRFINAVTDAAPGTRQLIVDGLTVLRTGNATQEQLATIVRSFDVLAQGLADNDADFGQLLVDGGEAADTIEELVRTQTGPFQELLRGTGAIGTALSRNTDAIEVLFGLLPRVGNDLSKVARDGVFHGDLTINVGQPLCSTRPLAVPATSGAADPKPCAKGPGLLQRGPD
ncbi:MCE family protein [Pimelobacter simplex]|uniref:MCE family protein n=1 Tax=Nocardioides simplex TaxID=2045 RepID=UPI00214FD965|nr:MCE family protein [Pimelobacter simplex]UUW91898.1 MCE family protein [Pimelobacter simplex]UUW95725.1 MCE family protein [Pimelobacter simplex]